MFIAIAEAAVSAAGFTPCLFSSFETGDSAYAFSVESVAGRSEYGPKSWAEVSKATGAVFVNNRPA